MYGPADDNESTMTIHAALDNGVTLLDTGDFYGIGHNEMLIGRALKGRRDQALLSVKFGAMRSPGGGWIGYDARPEAVKNSLAHSLTRLQVDYVDIYRPARLDSRVPIEDTIGAIADLVKEGYVRAIGLSEVGPETIRRAMAVHPICDLQIEYSLISRGPEARIFPALDDLGIGTTAYGLLSRGLLCGSTPTRPNDIRGHFPRFTGDNFGQNQQLVRALETLARARGVTPGQLAIAWGLAKSSSLVPVVGVRTRQQLEENLGALDLELSEEEIAHIENAVPAGEVFGTRYGEPQMRDLDSERA
jgi:aryl-alcohol dehydrogenase-like predicted oxidoreductase